MAMDWKLGGTSGYREMFTGAIRPPSVSAIQTDAADYFGNPAGQAVEILMMTMLTYLGLSLLISAFMNWYNAKMALVER